jgi:CubicO group peptidase (beta-lactamase class C family)
MRAVQRVAILAVLLVVPACSPSDPASQARAVTTPIRSALRPFVDRRALAGVVTLVADKNKVLSLEAVGMADVAASAPMQKDAVFWIASQTKPVTATALMMLMDEGKVRLDDPVAKYLPEFRDAKGMTLRHLLTHTSGLPYQLPDAGPALDAVPLSAVAKTYAGTPLLIEPGHRYRYSNLGYNVLGRVVEIASGTPYEEFLDQRLLKPLGMKDTTFWPDATQLGRLAKCYRPAAGNADLQVAGIDLLTSPLSDRARPVCPSAGLFSTAADVSTFCRMILNDGTFRGRRYLSESAVKAMTSTQTANSIAEPYGFGWRVGDGFCWHDGVYGTRMVIDLEHQLVLVLLVQHVAVQSDDIPGDAFTAFRDAAVRLFGH